ncbi:MAG: hypothetical protein IKU83_02665 [Lachnospiraceae bacterium]|nr:hypothetical protein [Lachnospiraceae bacterium]
MVEVFRAVLNMSITASYVIVAVLCVRFCLRWAPRKYSYWLWSAVGFRLCCPISFETIFSLFRLPFFSATRAYQGNGLDYSHLSEGGLSVTIVEDTLVGQAITGTAVLRTEWWLGAGTLVWASGIVLLLGYGLWAAWRLHRQMKTAVRLRENVYQSEYVRSPFVLGIVNPRIYIPYGLDTDTLGYVLQHEQYHLKRQDPLVKAVAFGLLILHWFNPLVWLAFVLMSRDMEMRCDEYVLSQEEGICKAYSTSLLNFATNRRFEVPGPLAFGENDVTRRIKHVLNWKRPKTWVVGLAAGICMLVVLGCMANPSGKAAPYGTDYTKLFEREIIQELETGQITFLSGHEIWTSDAEEPVLRLDAVSYDGKIAVAAFEYRSGEGYVLDEVIKWEEMIPRGQDIKTGYYIKGGKEFFFVVSNNPNLKKIVFSGDYEAETSVMECPAFFVYDYLDSFNREGNFTMTYEFYDAAGNVLR